MGCIAYYLLPLFLTNNILGTQTCSEYKCKYNTNTILIRFYLENHIYYIIFSFHIFLSLVCGKFNIIIYACEYIFPNIYLFSYRKMHSMKLNASHVPSYVDFYQSVAKNTRSYTEFIHSIVPYSFPIHMHLCFVVVVVLAVLGCVISSCWKWSVIELYCLGSPEGSWNISITFDALHVDELKIWKVHLKKR